MKFFITFLSVILLFLPTCIFSKTLQNIETTIDQERINILLTFDQSQQLQPLITYETGLFRLFLSNSKSSPELKYQRVNNRFIRAIRTFPEGNSIIIEVTFTDPNFTVEGKILTKIKNNQIFIKILSKKQSNSDQEFVSLTINNKQSQNQTQLLGNIIPSNSEGDFSKMIFKMVLGLLAVLSIFYLFLWIYQKFFSFHILQNKKVNMKLRGSFYLGNKQKILLLEIENSLFVCGVTPQNITVIHKEHSTNNSWKEFLQENDSIDISAIRSQYKKYKQVNQNSEKKKDSFKEIFATELLNKVKTLRQFD